MRRQTWSALRTDRRPRASALRRSGAELLELGLVLGILLLLLFGTIEFGTYFYVEHNLQAAAREGARAACVYSDLATQNSVAANAVQQVLKQSSLWNWSSFQSGYTFGTTPVPDPLHPGQSYCQVTVQITWDKIPAGMRPMKLITNASGTVLKGVSTVRVEQ